MRVEVTGIDDYFAVFRLPRKLTVDGEALQARFYELSRAHHPDFHQGANADAQAKTLPAPPWSIAPIERCGTLARVEYLIALEEGRTPARAPRSARSRPGSLLAEMMDVQEALEEARRRAWMRRPAPGCEAERERLRERKARRRKPSSAGRRMGRRAGRGPTAGRCSSGSSARLAARAYLRTVIDDLSDALGEDLESHVSHRRH